MTLAVYDRNGRQVFLRNYGDSSPTRRIAVASASKLVSGVVLLRLVEQGFLTLDSTPAQVLGWSGPQGRATLRHLLSFTSGLVADPACTRDAAITLARCVEQIALEAPVAAPGVRFEYGSGHMHVAARMAEVATGALWDDIVQRQLRQPLGLPAGMAYFTFPRESVGARNPLVAGGLRATLDEYAVLLGVVFARGQYQGQRLIDPALLDLQSRDPYPGAVIVASPYQRLGISYRYGLGAWLECATPTTGCAEISSAGAFGFLPWVDRANGYYAILGMELSEAGGGAEFSVPLQQRLKPLIRTALAASP
jgi:CubicO group peptidase (beta-lactamase class C family)